MRWATGGVLQHLKKAILNKAKANEDKDFYMASNAGLESLYRIASIKDLGCWMGYLYFKNDTEMSLKQTVTLTLNGMEVFKRPDVTFDDAGLPKIV